MLKDILEEVRNELTVLKIDEGKSDVLDEAFIQGLIDKALYGGKKSKRRIEKTLSEETWSPEKELESFSLADITIHPEYRVGKGKIKGDKNEYIMLYNPRKFKSTVVFFDAGDKIAYKRLKFLDDDKHTFIFIKDFIA